MSPTQRTLAYARSLGFMAAVVERWNPHAKIRQDLFGCIDVLLVKEGEGIIGVQACADASHASRVAKVKAEPRMWEWIESGGRVEVWSWGLRGDRGKRKLWTCRREAVKSTDLQRTDAGKGGVRVCEP